MSLASEHGLWAPVVEGARKDRSEFGRLPRDLRDQLISGFDSGGMTLDAARDLLLEQGHDISRTAIGVAYAKLRRARRSLRNQDTLTRLLADFRAAPSGDTIASLGKVLAAQTAEAMLNDTESDPQTIKAAAKALESLVQMARIEFERRKLEIARAKDGGGQAPKEVPLNDVLERIYGIRR